MKFQVTFRDKADQDLIKWYKATPDGDRCHIIREALREYLKKNDTPSRRRTTDMPSNALRNLDL